MVDPTKDPRNPNLFPSGSGVTNPSAAVAAASVEATRVLDLRESVLAAAGWGVDRESGEVEIEEDSNG